MSDTATQVPVSPKLRFLLWLGAVCTLGVLLSSALIPTNLATPAHHLQRLLLFRFQATALLRSQSIKFSSNNLLN